MEIDYDRIIKVPEEGLTVPGIPEEVIPEHMKNRVERTLIPGECIRNKIISLAGQLSSDYSGTKELNFVVILKGAAVFAADIGREIFRAGGPLIKYHFIKASTYGTEIKDIGETGRKVKIELEPGDVRGKDVILLEDIVDQGFTLLETKKYLLKKAGVCSIKSCVLLDKKLRNPTDEVKEIRKGLSLDYAGFEVPDRWVAGYGADAGEDFRHLPFIVIVKEDYYLNK